MVDGLVGDLDASTVTGALTVTTGNAADNAITITTGSAATSITASGSSDTVTVNAAALAQNTLLTLSGSAAFVVDGLVGDLDASALTGTLTVTTGNAADNDITITTGSAATSITDSVSSDTVHGRTRCAAGADHTADAVRLGGDSWSTAWSATSTPSQRSPAR